MSYSDYINYSLDPTGKPRFFGFYRGIVKNINDPLKSNRLQVSVPQITGTDALDWASPSLTGTVTIPAVGDKVWVTFESGDTSYPVWLSGFSGSGGTVGPAGPAGASGGSYVHNQQNASDAWTINHNLGYYPQVSLVINGENAEGDINHANVNTLVVNFTYANSGIAYLS